MVVLCNHYRCCCIAYTAHYFQCLCRAKCCCADYYFGGIPCSGILFHNYVELQNEELIIVFGFIKKKIPYGDILSLSSTRDASSSLAASLDRIEIKYKNKSAVMISVVDKEGFFNKMKEYHPDMIIKFIPEVTPEPDEIEAIMEAKADKSPTISHEDIFWN